MENKMCGRFNVNNDSYVQLLLEELDVVNPEQQRYAPFIMPCQDISIIVEQQSQRKVIPAKWWLLLDAAQEGFKPSKYTSFNTRYDKVNQRGSAGYQSFREQRCIIPASGFGETLFINKKPMMYHNMTAQHNAIAFAGLYKTWRHQRTGEFAYSCSIITNAPHLKLAQIHTKASPAALTPQQFDSWLDPHQRHVDIFDDVLKPRIVNDLLAQQINKPSLREPVGASFVICAD